MNSAYTNEKVKKGVVAFFYGKLGNIVVGLGSLLLLVRALSPSEYGLYVALLSMLEILQLVSSFGLISVAQRYVTDLQVKREFPLLVLLIKDLYVARVLLLLLAVLCLWPFLGGISTFFGVQGYLDAIKLYLVVVLLEGTARYVDVVLDSLFLQGSSQVSSLIRGGGKFVFLAVWMLLGSGDVPIGHWILAESFACFVGLSFGVAKSWRYCKSLPHDPAALSPGRSEYRRYCRYSIPMYVSQVLYLGAGLDSLKLIASRIAGAGQVGGFGFGANLGALLQRYLPVFLLGSVIRPIFVSARNSDGFNRKIESLLAILLKLNIFTLLPFVVFVLAEGEGLARVLTAGRLSDAVYFLQAFTVAVVFQSTRSVVSLAMQTLELGRASLLATIASLSGLFCSLLLVSSFGLIALCFGIAIGEIVWIIVAVLSLRGAKFLVRIDYLALTKMLLVAFVAYTFGLFSKQWVGGAELLRIVLSGGVVFLVYFMMLAFLKPFSSEDRDWINGFIRRRLFIW